MSVSAQPFQIGHTTISFTDTSRNGRSIPTEIYYPADMAGNNVPVTTANTDHFPLLSFGHGFVMSWDAYQNIRDAVVPEGFIIAFPTTEGSLSPSHSDFGKDITYIISAIAALSQDSTSIFFNRVDTMNCVMGHSMGGGAAFLGAEQNTVVKTLVTLAPAETNPSAIQAAAGLSIPSLIIAGGNDCVTPPPANQIPMYDSLQSSCKTFISINGGSHCQMADNNFFCNFGEATCTPAPAITRAQQHITINSYLLPWLKYELKNDCIAGSLFDSLISVDTSIVFQKTCLLCNTTNISEFSDYIGINFHPNPFTGKIYLQNNMQVNRSISMSMYMTDGRKIFLLPTSVLKANEQLEVDLKEELSPGIYLLEVISDGKRIVKKMVRE